MLLVSEFHQFADKQSSLRLCALQNAVSLSNFLQIFHSMLEEAQKMLENAVSSGWIEP